MVLDARCQLPPRSRLAVGARDIPTLVICDDADPTRRAALESLGIETASCPLVESRPPRPRRHPEKSGGERFFARVFRGRAAHRRGADPAGARRRGAAPHRPPAARPQRSRSPVGKARKKLDDPDCYQLMAQGLLGADGYSPLRESLTCSTGLITDVATLLSVEPARRAEAARQLPPHYPPETHWRSAPPSPTMACA